MDGSCDLEGVVPNGGSPASSVCTDTPLPSEKYRASVDSDNGSLEEAQICMDFSKSISLGPKKGFRKSATFPISAGEVEQGDDNTDGHGDDVMKDVPAYERSVSLPPTLKPISAMKGSRQKNGMTAPMENRHVKWAPDVYDPPVTSVCHSVTSSYHYQRRSKPRKKDKNKEKTKQKKKHKTKSKKSHQNSIQTSSVLQTPDLGMEDFGTLEDVGTSHGLGKQEAEHVDYSVGKDAKCGSSFLRESVARMHFPISEAS